MTDKSDRERAEYVEEQLLQSEAALENALIAANNDDLRADLLREYHNLVVTKVDLQRGLE